MRKLILMLVFSATAGVLAGCNTSSGVNDSTPENSAALEQLELRVNQLERDLKDVERPAIETDSKTPPGPLRSLTLRLGTDDDRLRLYWADGQESNLICSQEGQGTWACG